MIRFANIAGKRFGNLVAVARSSQSKNGTWKWAVRCDCGREEEKLISELRRGAMTCCRPCQNKLFAEQKSTHGLTKSRTYISWKSMKARCTNPRSPDYKYYGERGVTVCPRWDSFENFFADMGERPAGRSLDREETDGNYEPGNCRWATPTEQANNRRKRA